MSDPNTPPSRRACGADSRDAINIVFEGPADTTVRPCAPEHRARLQVEREKWLRWKHLLEQPPAEADLPADTTTEG
jgi:hypothetical protein